MKEIVLFVVMWRCQGVIRVREHCKMLHH